MDIKERIEKAKDRLEAAKNAKTKAETQLEAAQDQCDKVVEEMKQLGSVSRLLCCGVVIGR